MVVVVLVEWWRKLKNKQDSILSLYNSRRCVCVYCSNFVDIIQFWLLWHNGLKMGHFLLWYGTRMKFWQNSNSIYNAAFDILFPSNCNIHKRSCGLCFWASDPLIDRFYYNLSMKESEAQKQWPDKLWMLWFDEKSIFNALCFGDSP